MFKRFKDFCLTIAALTLFAVPMALPAVASAAVAGGFSSIAGGVCDGSKAADGSGTLNFDTTGSACTDVGGTTGLQGILKLIVNVFSIIVGFVAVVMIIFGGFKYITSGGDSGNISGAKNTIVYAIVGLIIVALSQVIVHFVLAKANTAIGPAA